MSLNKQKKKNVKEASPLQHSCRTPSKELASSNILHQNGSRTTVKDSNGPQLRSASRSSCKEVSRTSSKESAVGGSSSNVPDNRTTPNQLHRPANKDPCFSHSGDIQKSLREQQQQHHAKSSPGLISRISPTLFTESRTSWDHKEIEEAEFSPDGHLSPYMDSMSNTDCGSLSKSSSDGDPIICRRRPPTRLKSKRRNILSFPQALGLDDTRLIQRRHECYGGSSSDENKSSGHASMSDGQSSYLSSSPTDGVLSKVSGRLSGKTDDSFYSDGVDSSEHRFGRGTPLKSVPEDERLLTSHHASSTKLSCRKPAAPTRKPHRTPLEGACGLEDIRQAIEQLSVRTHGSRTSYSTSTYSSMSGSESEPVRRLMRHSSLETINTNITSADEFVWVDNHTRLVELQRVPWSNHDILKVMQTGRLREHLGQISMETVPRLSYLLQRPLVRIARETQRLSKTLGMCTKQEVSGSLKIVLSPALADSCIKACHRSAAISAVSGDQMKLSKSARAGLQLSVGRFHRWMCDVRIGSFVHQYAAIYLTAAIENLLEEIVLQCMPLDGSTMFTATMLETAISNSSDLWGLFQPFSHLNAGRTATETHNCMACERSELGSRSDPKRITT
ncbi:Ankyrin repeat and BTB/POZ domain-containing protein 2 [Araneus ventricosus]|uniref:Ankyrin repeat and BTB/POZ domain-containing protein 2 n=1 Tax=Araneus ventricosus TaxID=182803 RepID=A0A4Y2V903_ARAVE|nr:Ankyrin repeat and BTB/POZ domain-containing protein 2 [Araneus ventricosus]